MRPTTFLALTLTLASCDKLGDPFTSAFPPLPPTGGAAIASAGRLTEVNFAAERVDGPASQGLVGDFFMRNDKVRLVLQAPGRAIGPCPYGGNVIDLDFVDSPRGDQLGEVSPMVQLGRTLNALDAEVVRDGAAGGPAVIRFTGRDAWDDFINLKGLGSFANIIADTNLANIELGWKIAATYILMPGATSVRVVYTFYNPTAHDMRTTWGTLSDTGAKVEIFHPGQGFGETSIEQVVGGSSSLVDHVAFQGVGLAYGIAPIFADASVRGAAIPVSGVNLELYEVSALFDAFGDAGTSLVLPSGTATSREIAIVLGRDVGDVTAQVRAARKEATLALSGTVTGTSAAGARIAVSLASGDPKASLATVLVADADGHFEGALPAGRYRVQAEGEALVRSPEVEVELPSKSIALALSPLATLRYTIHDRAGEAIPGKVIAIGARPNEPDKRFHDITKDILPKGIAGWAHALSGVSTDTPDPLSGADRALHLAPGHYRVVVSRGPEWSRDERVLDLGADGATIDAVLDHVVPTPGYAASDFHQHSNKSPDAPVPPVARALSYVVEGVDFASTSEHDFVFDLQPAIDAVGAHDLLGTAVGIETTTWDYGHYIGFPLTPDPLSPNGGALDWANGENMGGMGLNLPPPVIFDRLHAAGAKVVQVTHPRALPGASTDFQQSFDRGGLRFDFAARSFFGDSKLMPVEAAVLGLPPDAQMISATFDTLEVWNGFHHGVVGDERVDQKVDLILRDWMNFLSFGFTPAPTGVSDTHTWIADPAGMARTLVAVADDSPAAITAGVGDEIARTLSGRDGLARDVIVTNGPFLRFTVDGAGIGRTVSHPSGALSIHVEVHTASWEPVDTVEIFANNTFDSPSMTVQALQPLVCFTSKPTPSARCAAALGGARPLPGTLVETVPGIPASTRRDIVLDVNDLTVEQIAAATRPGAASKDAWLAVRATGSQALYPSLPNEVDKTALDALILGTPLFDEGVPAMAFTNAIFVDVDGGGWRGPFSP